MGRSPSGKPLLFDAEWLKAMCLRTELAARFSREESRNSGIAVFSACLVSLPWSNVPARHLAYNRLFTTSGRTGKPSSQFHKVLVSSDRSTPAPHGLRSNITTCAYRLSRQRRAAAGCCQTWRSGREFGCHIGITSCSVRFATRYTSSSVVSPFIAFCTPST